MRNLLAVIVILVATLNGHAQDIHFSQYFATPLFTNPAFTGHFDGTYRFAGIARSQWASVSPQPYQTFGGSFDMHAPFNIKSMGVGVQASHDFAGLSSLTTSQVYGLISQRFRLFGERGITLHFGAMGGFFIQSIDFSKLSFDDQFNGIRYDPGNPSNHPRPDVYQISNFNLAAGTYIEQKRSERSRMGLGFSAFNLNSPDRTYFKSNPYKLNTRYNVHFLSSLKLGSSLDLMPGAQLMVQGNQQEIIAGAAFRYHLSTGIMNPQSLQLGFWARPGDAGFITAGMQLNKLYIGGSYDVNLSRLLPATNYRGGWEASIIYIIPTVREKVKRLRQCPDYL